MQKRPIREKNPETLAFKLKSIPKLNPKPKLSHPCIYMCVYMRP